MRRRAPVLAPAALALVALLVAPALAHEGDGRPHVQSFQEARTVKATTTRETLEYELDRQTDATFDAIWVRFDGKRGVVEYEYREEEASPSSAFVFRVAFVEVVEFLDQNGNEEFDRGPDRLVRAYPVSAMRWNVSEPRVLPYRGQELVYVVANGTFAGFASGPHAPTFRIEFVAHGRALDVALARMHPQDVKMTWNFAHAPFRLPDSRLALVARFEAPAGVALDEETAEDGTAAALFATAPRRFAFLDWANVTRGNSTGEPPQERPVRARVASATATTADGGVAREVVFSYVRADWLLSHDPDVGFEYGPPERPPPVPANWIVGGFLLAAAAGGGAWAWKRRVALEAEARRFAERVKRAR